MPRIGRSLQTNPLAPRGGMWSTSGAMGVRVDLDNRRIQASFGALAATAREGPRGLGLLGQARAELGGRIHQRYREEAAGRPGFRAEVELALQLEVDGFSAAIHGRADGVIDHGDGSTLVEEVKSVALGGAELAAARPAFFPDHCLQLRLYALALAESGCRRLSARLLLFSLADGSRLALDVPLHPDSTRARLQDLLRRAIADARAERERAHRLAAAAGALVFPYPSVRPHQDALIDAFAAGLAHDRPVLAMAPTGIGKTVAALLAGLRFALRRPARMAFLTSRTTQRELVARTFADLCAAAGPAAAGLHALVLQAKESMCPPGHLLCHPEACDLLADFQTRLQRSGALSQLLGAGPRIEPEQVIAVGEAHRLCPFALSRALVERVELVIGDYNHLFDPGIAIEELYTGSSGPVVVIDEAHNLFDRARSIWSPFLARAALERLDQQLAAGAFLAPTERQDQLSLTGLGPAVEGPALCAELAGLIDDATAACESEQRRAEHSGLTALEDCRPVEPDRDRWRALGERAVAALVPYLIYNRAYGVVRPDDPMLAALTELARLRQVVAEPTAEVIAYAAGTGAPTGAGFGCLCVDPAPRLVERHRRAAGSLAMSATLTPLGYWADVLGLTPLDPTEVSLPSPFVRENLCARVVGDIDTTFRRREQTAAAVAQTIAQTFRARSGRYAVYFPSYRYLELVRARLPSEVGPIVVQLPGLGQGARHRLLERFRASSGPALLLAVMGGIFAEGIDLPGEELVGAVVVGPGLPQVGFERAAMQHYFEQRLGRGFAYAMLYPGLQRVIQAAGRVIRSPDDRGVIVLIGRRFATPEILASLPEHWYRHQPEELLAADLPAELEAFWAG